MTGGQVLAMDTHKHKWMILKFLLFIFFLHKRIIYQLTRLQLHMHHNILTISTCSVYIEKVRN